MILRYPGGKKKVAKYLAPALLPCRELREPFCGSSAVAITALTQPNPPERVWLNDIDPGVASMWTSVIREPEALIERIKRFRPSVTAFKDYRDELLADVPLSHLERGFRKLVVHQLSFSGLGTVARSPMGGWSQGSGKKCHVGSRWNPIWLIDKIRGIHMLLRGRVFEDRCTSLDALEVINAPGSDVALYLDPPYVAAGALLYQHRFSEAQHRALAMVLMSTPHKWLLSYDDHDLVWDLYVGERIVEASWGYTMKNRQGEPGKRGTELLIGRGLRLPKIP